MKFGACFFGWLTATGTAVLVASLLTAVGAGAGLGRYLTPQQPSTDLRTTGLIGAVVVGVVVLVAYIAGGYVAGRMARFNGARQGVGVWLWAVIVAIVLAVLSLIAGSRFNVLANVNGLPIPVSATDLSVGGVIAALVLAALALVGAVLGGVLGMRYHRRVDRADLTDPADSSARS